MILVCPWYRPYLMCLIYFFCKISLLQKHFHYFTDARSHVWAVLWSRWLVSLPDTAWDRNLVLRFCSFGTGFPSPSCGSFFSSLSLFRPSGKGKNMNIPKTSQEFDYDHWITGEQMHAMDADIPPKYQEEGILNSIFSNTHWHEHLF